MAQSLKAESQKPASDAIRRADGGICPRFWRSWSQSPHFTLNITLFQRAPLHPDVPGLVGDFTSVLLLEIQDDRSDSFEVLARRIAAQFRSDLEHREYGGAAVLQEIAKRGDPIGRRRCRWCSPARSHKACRDGRRPTAWARSSVGEPDAASVVGSSGLRARRHAPFHLGFGRGAFSVWAAGRHVCGLLQLFAAART